MLWLFLSLFRTSVGFVVVNLEGHALPLQLHAGRPARLAEFATLQQDGAGRCEEDPREVDFFRARVARLRVLELVVDPREHSASFAEHLGCYQQKTKVLKQIECCVHLRFNTQQGIKAVHARSQRISSIFSEKSRSDQATVS